MELKERYQTEIKRKLKEELGLDNIMAVPRVVKVVVNVGVKDAIVDKKILETVGQQLAAITGQKAVVRKARKSIAAFKLRAGMPIGLAVTMRGKRMYDFLEKLFAIVLPRVRDFHGTRLESFDGRGNYTLGMSEQIVFPEIEYGKIDKIRGLEITIITNAQNNQRGEALLRALGVPFVKKS